MTSTHSSPQRLTKDAFLFSVQQSATARSLADGRFDSHLRYEPFLLGNYVLPKNASVSSFRGELQEIVEHQFRVLPHFRKKEEITLQNVAYFSQSIATLFADITSLLRAYTGQNIPRLPLEEASSAPSFEFLNAAIQKYTKYVATSKPGDLPYSLYPLRVEGEFIESEEQAGDKFAREIWFLIHSSIQKIFTVHADAIFEYVSWSYAPATPKSQTDWRVRPPVGDEFFQQHRPPDRDRNGRGGRDRDGRGGRERDRGERGDRGADRRPRAESSHSEELPSVPKTPQYKKHTDSSDAKASDLPRERPPVHNEVQQSSTSSPSKRYTRDEAVAHRAKSKAEAQEENPTELLKEMRRKAEEQGNIEKLERALQSVEIGAKKLSSNPDLGHFRLHPANPFFRRAQHALAVQLGFETESQGEGKERCVCMKVKG